jgi:hypothetical protein
MAGEFVQCLEKALTIWATHLLHKPKTILHLRLQCCGNGKMRGVSCLAKGPLGDMPLRDSFDPFNSIKDPATSCGVEGQ